jgi:hypothetical protein
MSLVETQHGPAATTPRDVEAALNFLVPQDSKPYFKSAALTGGEPELFFKTEQHRVTVRDMRPIADTLSLDRQGFELHRQATAVEDLHDDAAIRGTYERELDAMLRALTGAERVVVFDHTRRSDSATGAANPDGLRGPASRVHVDYTVTSGPVRATDVLGAAVVDRALAGSGRIVQVNVWRPIKGPVLRAPLALGDAASIAPGELVATDQLFPGRVGEIYYMTYGAGQRWYWAPAMQRDEVILIKGWDSLDDGRARFTPHGAFQLADAPSDAPPRESIESRTFLVFEN